MTADVSEKLAEIFTDYLNASESAIVNAKRQIAELFNVAEKKSSAGPAAVSEETFTLKFELQKGVKLGDYALLTKPII